MHWLIFHSNIRDLDLTSVCTFALFYLFGFFGLLIFLISEFIPDNVQGVAMERGRGLVFRKLLGKAFHTSERRTLSVTFNLPL